MDNFLGFSAKYWAGMFLFQVLFGQILSQTIGRFLIDTFNEATK